jgi:hypothetical protein
LNKSVFLLILSLLITIIFPIVLAQDETGTEVGGVLNENTTWTLENSPFFLTAPLLVNEGVTLTIEPGVTVYLTDHYIRVAGTLNARGTPTNPISIICNSTEEHLDAYDDAPIQFTSTSTSWNEQTGFGSIIENTIINSTKKSFTIYIFESSPKINNSTVLTTGGQRAIFIEGGDSVVSNCSITSNQYGMTVRTSRFLFNYGTCNALISGNIISGCKTGINIGGGSPIVENNLITNNHGDEISGDGGIRIDDEITTPLIRNNTIIGNSVGFNLIGSPSPTIMFNNIHDNDDYNIYLYDNSGSDIVATQNWWGTTDVSSINQSIRDFKNDFNLGTVTFVPFLMELNPNAPNLPLMVDFIHPYEPLYASNKIDFDASACYGEYSNISSYSWDFGDENTTVLSAPLVTHAYTTAGYFDVILTVTDEYGFQNSKSITVTILEDDSPPTTTYDYDGAWRTSDFTITLSAVDEESGVAETYYRINGGAIKTLGADGQPFVTTEGADNTLEYWSTDDAGNEELHKNLTEIKLDKTVPAVGEAPQNPDEEIQPDQSVSILVTVQDSVSVVKNVTLLYTTDNGGSWTELEMVYSVASDNFQASIPGQAEGVSVEFKIVAYDNAGNSEVDDNGGQYYVYSVVPEFSSALILAVIFAVAFVAVTIFRKIQPPKWEDFLFRC